MDLLGNNKITNYTCDGKCSNCGQCCGDLLNLSHKEVKVIKDYLRHHRDIKATPMSVMALIDNTCPFRDNENKKCKIYEVRPEICRRFKCDYTEEDIFKTRDMINKVRQLHSMRQLFFKDDRNAQAFFKLGMFVYDEKGNIIGGK